MPYETFPILVARAPNATPTTFTTIGELDTVAFPDLTSNDADASYQNSTVDRYVMSTLIRRSDTSLRINFLPYDGTHDHSTGLLNAKLIGSFDGYKFSHAASSALWVASGFVKAFKLVTPKEGVMSADVTLRFSGQFTVQGVTQGT